MPNKKHHIKLSSEEREELQVIARKEGAAVIKVQRARAMLAADCSEGGPGMTDLEASLGSGLSLRSVERLRARVCEVGPLGALERKQRQTCERRSDSGTGSGVKPVRFWLFYSLVQSCRNPSVSLRSRPPSIRATATLELS